MKSKSEITQQETNIFELLDAHPLPSLKFMVKKEFNNYVHIQNSILEKEALFKICNFRIYNFSLEAVELERDLGDLYRELLISHSFLKQQSK